MNDLKERVINSIRKDPRGFKHWKRTNKLIDQIIKETLNNSPILNFNPQAWLSPLFHSYFNLRSHYWGAFFESALRKSEKRHFFNLFGLIDLKIPLYIRIISILIRICVDRIIDGNYTSLQKLPSHYYFGPEYFGIAASGVMFNIENYLNEISNDLFIKLHNFFIECRGDPPEGMKESLDYSLLFPIPISFIGDYQDFLKTLNKKYSEFYSGEDKHQHQGNLTIVTPAYIEFLTDPKFGLEILKDITKFLKKILEKYEKYEDCRELIHQFYPICNFYEYIFKRIPNRNQRFSAYFTEILENDLIYSNQNPDILHKLTYNLENREVSIADPFSCKNIFKYSLDIFDRPFIQLPNNIYIISIYWLYDSLVNYFSKNLRQFPISTFRGFHAENYISYLIDQDKDNSIVSYESPFKLIIRNPDMQEMNQGYLKLKKNLEKFKFPVYEIDIKEEIIENKYQFIEIDCAIISSGKLLIIEIKDDLFWDIRDLPYFYLIWYKKLKEKQQRIKEILMKENIKKELQKINILYDSVDILVLTQPHINHPNYTNIYTLYHELISILGDKKMITFSNYQFPKYPF